MLSKALGVIFSMEAFPPKNKAEAIAQDFYPCMVRGPQPKNADPSSLLWCRDDNLFKRNFQHAKTSAKENKKSLGLDFNPSPSAPVLTAHVMQNPMSSAPFQTLMASSHTSWCKVPKWIILTMLMTLMKPQLLLQSRRS